MIQAAGFPGKDIPVSETEKQKIIDPGDLPALFHDRCVWPGIHNASGFKIKPYSMDGATGNLFDQGSVKGLAVFAESGFPEMIRDEINPVHLPAISAQI